MRILEKSVQSLLQRRLFSTREETKPAVLQIAGQTPARRRETGAMERGVSPAPPDFAALLSDELEREDRRYAKLLQV